MDDTRVYQELWVLGVSISKWLPQVREGRQVGRVYNGACHVEVDQSERGESVCTMNLMAIQRMRS